MSTEKKFFISPVGRLLQGDLFQPSTTDMHGRPLMDSKGDAREEWYIAVGFDKNNPEALPFLEMLEAEARQAWPNLPSQGPLVLEPNFSSKIMDGDAPDNAQKQGFAGCWVVKFKNGYAPKVYASGGNQVITDPNQIKRGYYIRVSGNYVTNANTEKPGMFVNFNMAELVGYGEEIQTGPSGEVFAQQQPGYTPPGMSQTPIAPQTTAQGFGQPQQPQQPGGFGQPQQPQQPGGFGQPQQPQQPQPDYGFLNTPQQ